MRDDGIDAIHTTSPRREFRILRQKSTLEKGVGLYDLSMGPKDTFGAY